MNVNTNVKDLVVPVSMVAALLFQSFQLGRASEKFETLQSVAVELSAGGKATHEQLLRLEDRLDFLEKEDSRREKMFELLKDYTEGRIAHLPYRPLITNR